MSEQKIPIPARLYNAAVNGHVAGTEDIIDDVKGKNQSQINTEVDNAIQNEIERATEAESDRYTKSEVYSKEETYNKNELNNLITTPSQKYVSVVATDQTTAVTDVLPATGAADTTYRVGNWDGTQYNDSVFSEYAWNGSAYIKLDTKSQIGEVYDISANHADTKYADLSAALGTNGANIPVSLRKGGMSVKYVQSSDNKYVQFRLMSDSFSTTVSDWQGVDEEVLPESKNLVDSNGIWVSINGDWKRESYNGTPSTLRLRSPYISVNKNTVYRIHIPDGFKVNVCFYENGDSGTILETSAMSDGSMFDTNNFDKLRFVVQPDPDGTITLNDLPKFCISPIYDEVLLNTAFTNQGIVRPFNGHCVIYHPFYITAQPTITTNIAFQKCYFDENMNFISLDTYDSSARFVMIKLILNNTSTALTKYSGRTIIINDEIWKINQNGKFEQVFAPTSDTEKVVLALSTDGDNTNNLYHGLKDMEFGRLSSGQPVDSTNRLRSKDYIEVPLLGGQPHPLNVSINTTFGISIVCYDANKAFLRDITVSQIVYFDSDVRYIKLVLRPNPDKGKVPVIDWTGVNLVVSLYLEDNLSLRKSINNCLDADLYDTANSILTQKWVNRNFAGDVYYHRLISADYIPIKPFTNYILKKLASDDNHHLEAGIYDKDFNRLGTYGWDNSFFSGSACYAKFLYKYGDNENVSPLSFIPFTVKEDVCDNTINYYPKFASGWEYGSINDDGTNPSTTVYHRARTDYFNISSPGVLELSTTTGWGVQIFLYDEDKTKILSEQRITEGTTAIQLPIEAKYFRLKIMPVPDSTTQLSLTAVAMNGCNIYLHKKCVGNSYLKHLKLTQWNMGLLNHGISTGQVWGIPNDELDAELPDLKDVITRIDADVLFINEYSTYVDRNKTMLTYETLFKQFYGYRYTPFNGNVAIMSKYPMNVYYEQDVVDRLYITGEILINGNAIPFCLLHFSPFSYQDRTNEIQALIGKLSSYTRGIVVGDFNFGNNSPDEDIASQIALFTSVGYVVGNYGYWGIKATYTDNVKALDNICVKGMNMSSFDVLDDASVSDHYPTFSKVSFLINK